MMTNFSYLNVLLIFVMLAGCGSNKNTAPVSAPTDDTAISTSIEDEPNGHGESEVTGEVKNPPSMIENPDPDARDSQSPRPGNYRKIISISALPGVENVQLGAGFNSGSEYHHEGEGMVPERGPSGELCVTGDEQSFKYPGATGAWEFGVSSLFDESLLDSTKNPLFHGYYMSYYLLKKLEASGLLDDYRFDSQIPRNTRTSHHEMQMTKTTFDSGTRTKLVSKSSNASCGDSFIAQITRGAWYSYSLDVTFSTEADRARLAERIDALLDGDVEAMKAFKATDGIEFNLHVAHLGGNTDGLNNILPDGLPRCPGTDPEPCISAFNVVQTYFRTAHGETLFGDLPIIHTLEHRTDPTIFADYKYYE